MTTTPHGPTSSRPNIPDPMYTPDDGYDRAHHERVPERSDRSVGRLLRDLTDDVTTLLRKELALARSEVGSAVSEIKTGVGGVAAGGAVLYAGVLFLLGSATLGLMLVVDGWLAALIVGAVTSIVGFIMMKSAQRKLQPEHFKPERTAESLRRDSELMHRRTTT